MNTTTNTKNATTLLLGLLVGLCVPGCSSTDGDNVEVLESFVHRVWAAVAADGVVTEQARRRLAALVDGLHLPEHLLPEPIRRAFGD